MKNIVVAGAGHGGLAAALILAKNGYAVTVYEKSDRASLGHDWEDRFTFDVLSDIIGFDVSERTDIWRYRGDCAFLSPKQNTKVVIRYDKNNRQKVMWRKPLIELLVSCAEQNGVKLNFECEVQGAIIKDNRVVGIKTSEGEVEADLVIDSAGVFSPVKESLPDSFNIEKGAKRGDLFYAYRAYYNLLDNYKTDVPFEVYLYHEGEQGLSWHCTNENSVDILIGRIDPLTDEKRDEQLEIFKRKHPWTGDEILNGGSYGIIPVRRPLTKMVANGYAAIGDCAFMTTPMNGMGIDLALNAGRLLANTIMGANDFSEESLWAYNRDFHIQYGGDTAKNEGLKNSLLSMPSVGVDFLFDNGVIQSSDLAGAGKNTNLPALLGKFVNGMKNPKYFFTIINGLMKGAKAAKLYKSAPEKYDEPSVISWSNKIKALDIEIPRY